MEPVLLLGLQRFQNLDIRVKVRGSGYVAQIYAIRQAIAKGVVAYYQKYVSESEKRQIKCTFNHNSRDFTAIRPNSFGCRS